MEELQELLQFLDIGQRLDLKAVALSNVLSLTGSADGKAVILDFSALVQAIAKLTTDSSAALAKDAVLALINLTGDEPGALKVYDACQACPETSDLLRWAMEAVVKNNALSDPWTMVLSNMTRVERLAEKSMDEIERDEQLVLRMANAYSRVDAGAVARLHYIASIFCNLTQSSRGRVLFCTSRHNLLRKVLPFVTYADNVVRRGGTIGVLKNVCFDPVYHDLLFGGTDDILCALLKPLIGPEEFSDEENDKFPMDLQYMSDDKMREDDPDLRKMLLESLLQLCATKKYREYLRAKGTYEILREYHKWEADKGDSREALLACENVVDILIRKEDEINIDNLKQIEVPTDLSEKFIEDDRNFIEDKPIC